MTKYQYLKKWAKQLIRIIIAIFAAIGFILTGGYFAVKFGLTNSGGIIDDRFLTRPTTSTTGLPNNSTPSIKGSEWQQSPEWQDLKIAIAKDAPVINRVAQLTGVPARLITTQLVVEQLRLFNSEREVYKQIFAPLKILGNQSQFSWGVLGLKEQTAVQTETHLLDPASPFYLGDQYAHLLDFKTADHNQERYERIVNTDRGRDHYYGYLYAALFLKQIMTQWSNAGFPIADRPEVLSTIYNIGFSHSEPKPNPAVGGAALTIADRQYSFGGLAYEFYYSDELLTEFPR